MYVNVLTYNLQTMRNWYIEAEIQKI